ncbi:MAG: hypothetical protein PHD51_04710 [Patescibacteria group bacterium]|nr:hypothetical protein [Patescibacteria group bacterium]MDD5043921.1 hypothetical protein [Patescibacteria group bacterium]MDD5490754.1 hypothetical protein [Patescibacteria group bacterium]
MKKVIYFVAIIITLMVAIPAFAQMAGEVKGKDADLYQCIGENGEISLFNDVEKKDENCAKDSPVCKSDYYNFKECFEALKEFQQKFQQKVANAEGTKNEDPAPAAESKAKENPPCESEKKKEAKAPGVVCDETITRFICKEKRGDKEVEVAYTEDGFCPNGIGATKVARQPTKVARGVKLESGEAKTVEGGEEISYVFKQKRECEDPFAGMEVIKGKPAGTPFKESALLLTATPETPMSENKKWGIGFMAVGSALLVGGLATYLVGVQTGDASPAFYFSDPDNVPASRKAQYDEFSTTEKVGVGLGGVGALLTLTGIIIYNVE